MVKHQKHLALLTLSFFSLLCVNGYTEPAPDYISNEAQYTQDRVKDLEKIKVNVTTLKEEDNRKSIAEKSIETTQAALPTLKKEENQKSIADKSIEITQKALSNLKDEANRKSIADKSIETTQKALSNLKDEDNRKSIAEKSIEVTQAALSTLDKEANRKLIADKSIEITQKALSNLKDEDNRKSIAEKSIEVTQAALPTLDKEANRKLIADKSIETTQKALSDLKEENRKSIAEKSIEIAKATLPTLKEESHRKELAEKSFELTNVTLSNLSPENKEKIIEAAFDANVININTKVLKSQFDQQGEKREGFLNEALTENSSKKDPIKLSQQNLKNQIDLQGENREEFLNEFLTEHSSKEDPIKLSQQTLKDQINLQGEEREKFLTEVLSKHYTETQRQALINDLLESPTNQKLIPRLSEKECKDVGRHANPTYVGSTHVIDWLNTAYFKGFFQPTMRYALLNGDTFNEFDTFNQWNLFVEPFGFYTQFRQDADPLKFNMYTAGISIGGEYTFFDRLVLGLGVAYSHSGVTWEELSDSANLNSLYFGPSLSYVFTHGYLSCTVFGMANFYQVSRETNLFPDNDKMKSNKSTTEYQSWDVVGRLEGGLAYEVAEHFFLYPTAKVDYLLVFKQDNTETLVNKTADTEDETELSIGALDGSYLNSRIGLQVTREFYKEELGYLIPSLSAGFINFTPLTHKDYQYKIEGAPCEQFTEKLNIGSWNQSYVGAGFAIIFKKAILVSLDYEMVIGADSPLHRANLRAEWSW